MATSPMNSRGPAVPTTATTTTPGILFCGAHCERFYFAVRAKGLAIGSGTIAVSRCSEVRPPGVNGKVDPRDVLRIVRGEERHRLGDGLGRHPADRQERPVVGEEARVQLG